MTFKLVLNAFNVNSQISGIWTSISILQQLDMGLPYAPTGDCSMNINFIIEMSLDQIVEAGLKERYRNSSTLHERIPMRSPQDIEDIAVRLSRLVVEWESPLGGNWNGKIPYSLENVDTLMQAMKLLAQES